MRTPFGGGPRKGGAGSTFELSAGRVAEDQAELRRLEVELALRTGEWPEWAVAAPPVVRYRHLAARPDETGDVLPLYAEHLASSVCAPWARTSLGSLRELAEVSGGPLAGLSAAQASAFLDHVRRTPGPHLKRKGRRTVATRNRALAACSRFYRWAVLTGRAPVNPFAGIRQLKEPDIETIEHLSRAERDKVLAAAESLPDGVAVWLALWCGMRRGEVARCRWAEIDLDRRRLQVTKSKTGKRRSIDLARPLVERLTQTPKTKRRGRVVPWPAETLAWEYQATALLDRLRERLPKLAKRIRWNVFRHTFASLLAQANVSLWKISEWLGNDVAVCQKHYAGQMPRHDEDIEKLA